MLIRLTTLSYTQRDIDGALSVDSQERLSTLQDLEYLY